MHWPREEVPTLVNQRGTYVANLGIRVVKASKYLGVITGNDPDMALAAITERENRVYRQLDAWHPC
jgi:hypothetical protein